MKIFKIVITKNPSQIKNEARSSCSIHKNIT